MSKKTILPAILYWIVCGVIGTVIVIASYEHGILYVKLYSHFFLYPFFFGWMSVALLMGALPLVKSVLRDWRKTRHFWLGIAVFATLALLLELNSENIAPWELSPSALSSIPNIYEHFAIDLNEPNDKHDTTDKEKFQNDMIVAASDAHNWSIFRYIYPLSFFLQTYALLSVFFVSGILARYRLSDAYIDGVDRDRFRRSLVFSAAAIIVAMLYSLMRIAYSAQKVEYYPAESIPAADYVILGLFVVALLFAVACFWRWLGEHLAGVVSFVFGGTGLVAVWKYEDVLISLFGANASFLNYLAVLCGMLAVGFLWYIIKPPERRNKGQSGNSV